jgi:hypothetical protein
MTMPRTTTDTYPPMTMHEAMACMKILAEQAVEDAMDGWTICIHLTPDGDRVIPSVDFTPTEH